MDYKAALHARPGQVTTFGATGLQALAPGSKRDSYCYVPPRCNPSHPAPLVLLLHGAGGHAHHGLDILRHLADDHGLILLAPASTRYTWDVIVESDFGTDVELIDQSLRYVFDHYAIDASRLAIGGFSDGASYALSLGIPNAELFTHMIAFSPGFVVPVVPRGQPKIFISHGTKDDVLPIDSCSRKIVPRLELAGYEVTYREFDGPHVIPPDIAREAVEWLMRGA
jgi:phospholipase/carboxylesterase